MRNNNYTISIVGLGGMGSQHAKMLNGVEGLQIVGTFDIDIKRQAYAKELGYHTYESLEAVLSDEQLDIVLIATPNHLHKDIAIQALQAGKHVICEKPVTLNSQELQDIIEVSQACNRLFVVHQNRRWDEDYLIMKKLYDEGSLGEVFRVETRVQGSRGIPGDWRQLKAFGGGMMLDWGVHLLDRLILMIPEKITDVYCQLSNVINAEVDDGFTLLLTFESGKTAVVEVGTSHYIALPKWFMAGTEGTAVIDDWDLNGKVVKLTTFEGKDVAPIVAGAGLTKTMASRIDHTIVEEALPRVPSDVKDFYRNVMATIAGKEEQIVKNEQVMRTMKLMEAAFESDRLKKVIKFE